jgi:hypothetical protein
MSDTLQLYALVPLPANGPARDAVLRDAIAYGGGAELLRKFFDADAVERDLANQQAQTAAVANRVVDIGAHLMDMTEALTVRADKQRRLDAKRKADQERQAAEDAACAEAAELRDWLDTHPEPGASTDETKEPEPGGELHVHPPPDKERYGAGDDQGALPTELQKGAPPPSGTYTEPDPEDLGGPKDPKQVAQPVSASFW